MSVPPPLLIQVEVWSSAGRVASYVLDHNDAAQRRVLGEQCRNAFEGGQCIRTTPLHGGSAGNLLSAEQRNAVLAGLRLLQHFNDCTCVVTDQSGAARHFRMEEIAEIRDDSGDNLNNAQIDDLCEAINAGVSP